MKIPTQDVNVNENERNPKIFAAGIAELMMAILLFVGSLIFLILSMVHVHDPPSRLNSVALIGISFSIGWLLVSLRLIQATDKTIHIRQRRRWILYWTAYSALIALFNVAAIIVPIVSLVLNDYAGRSGLVVGIIIAIFVIILRGVIFITVLSVYAKELFIDQELALGSRSSLKNEVVTSL